MKEYRLDLGGAALLAGFILLFFSPILASGVLLAPGDGIAQNFPLRVLVAESLRHGEIPFWNPYNFSGTPLLATIHPGVFYPGNLPFLVLPPVLAMAVTVMGTFWIAGTGVFAFARAVGLSRTAALLGGLVFMLGGFLTLNAQHISMIQVASLMPWGLWAVERHRTHAGSRFALGAGLILALQVLAGHPQMVAYSAIVTGVYGLWRLLGLPRSERLRFLAPLALAGGLGLGLTAIQLLPTLDFVRESQRQAVSYAWLTESSPPWAGLPALLFPSFLGSRSTTALLAHPLWPVDTWRWWLQGYMGLGAWLLALVVLLNRARPAIAGFWAATALASLLLVLGNNTPLYRLWGALPVVNQMPYPHRHLVEFNLAFAVLAALGFSALLDAARRREAGTRDRALRWAVGLMGLGLGLLWVAFAVLSPRFVARTQPLMPPGIQLDVILSPFQPAFWLPLVTFGLLAGAAFALWRRPTPLRQALLIAVAAIDLGVIGYHNGYWQLAPQAPHLVSEPTMSEARSLTVTPSSYPYYAPAAYLEALQPPTLGALYGQRFVNGYDAFVFKRYAQVLGMNSAGLIGNQAFWEPGHAAKDLLRLGTLRIDSSLVDQPVWRERLASWTPAGAAEGVSTFTRRPPLPAAWRVKRATVLTPEQVDARLAGKIPFSPREEALLERPGSGATLTGGAVTLERLSLNRLQLKTTSAGPGFLVVSESYDAGWKASVAGREVPVHRVDGLLIGLEVPAGLVEVSLTYAPPRWHLALLISGLSAAGFVSWAALAQRRRKRRHSSSRAT